VAWQGTVRKGVVFDTTTPLLPDRPKGPGLEVILEGLLVLKEAHKDFRVTRHAQHASLKSSRYAGARGQGPCSGPCDRAVAASYRAP
jgi:hypothetical protein